MSGFKCQNAIVLGLGTSGRAAALLLAREGARVTAIDGSDNEKVRAVRDVLRTESIEVLCGEKNLPDEKFDLAVVSPGIPIEHRWLAELKERGTEILPEFELGWSRLRSRAIAVTGTNGKSTVVKWLAESFREAGFTAEPCGNYGKPVCEIAMAPVQPDWAVIEVSSFQLEVAKDFRADACVLLNLLPNHLDRHPSFEAYAAAKARLFENCRESDFCIVPAGDLTQMKKLSGGIGTWKTFGPTGEFVFRNGAVLQSGRNLAELRGTYFDNDVLGVNASAVIAAFTSLGIGAGYAVTAAKKFIPLPHRMETVAEIHGVKFINDSKATTLSAVVAALKMCGGKARLIAGGILKERPGPDIKEMLAQRTAGVYVIGIASEDLFQAWADICPCQRCETLDWAVKAAFGDAQAGDVILLSPGCASFDQFTGYQQRGEVFRKLVKSLVGN